MKKGKKKTSQSFARRMIRVWIFGVALPLIIVETLILSQIIRINQKDVDEGIRNELDSISGDFRALMGGMNSLSWLMEADGTVGKNLHLYFDEEDTIKKGNLLIYLREQIANYEVANPSVGNLTYIYVPGEKGTPAKINETSLANGELPGEEYFLCNWQDISFYGPHQSKSKVASYPCISLLRSYRMKQNDGDIYIYLESGYRYLQNLIPESVMGMPAVFLIESADGRTMYSSDWELAPLYSDTDALLNESAIDRHRFKTFKSEEAEGWKLHIWIPVKAYYRLIYAMALNLSVITVVMLAACILISITQWRSIYRPFTMFEKKLNSIAESNDIEAKVEQMHIQEFDDSFALLSRLKGNILLLLNRVQEEEKRRSELEIRVVLGKINPHFLYNTLDTLKWYAAGKKDREMMRFITSLNKLLLYNMSKEKMTTLKEELEAISAYIVLQQLKYDLDFRLDTGKHPEILEAEMPRFVLQPIVENAILHSGTGTGRIWLEVELLANGKVAILVKNDGKPIDPQKIRDVLIQKKDISSNGIGLQYVARMLENRFGGDFVLKAERVSDGINVVEIRIPYEASGIRQRPEFSGGGAKP